MNMLRTLFFWCSDKVRFYLVKADLIPQLINTLNPLSLSLSDNEYMHTILFLTIRKATWFATPDGLEYLTNEDGIEQQAVHETIFKQVLVPSGEYIWHLCLNRFSIIDGDQSFRFFALLARLLEICPNYQPSMEFILHMPSRSIVATLSFSLTSASPLTTHTLPLPSASPSPLTLSHSPLPLPSLHSFLSILVTVIRSTRNTHIDCLLPSRSLSRRRVLHSSLLPSFKHNAITQQSPPS
ncbi:hypothetical protein BLNAU_11727 [Blattamonas nauphoetae]|uniref:Uncharacterized protein n=1 Tax=Blattamonas nauphoetae TaxID=2049346 RepID=A0ABQ9XP11_9EUKA|nr:hypothetical protein BLNAU_11727 [Blattamonas nauphoetae]